MATQTNKQVSETREPSTTEESEKNRAESGAGSGNLDQQPDQLSRQKQTQKQTKNRQQPAKPRTIKAVLDLLTDQERFDGLVAISGLSRAEYIRRCCLEREIKVVPQENLLAYAQLGQFQVQVRQLIKQLERREETPDFVTILTEVKSINSELVQIRRVITGRITDSEPDVE